MLIIATYAPATNLVTCHIEVLARINRCPSDIRGSFGVRKFSAIVLISYLLSVLSTQPAFAFEIFGYRIWGSEPVHEPAEGEVAYTVLFHIPDTPKQLINELRSASSLLSDAPTPAANSAALLARILR